MKIFENSIKKIIKKDIISILDIKPDSNCYYRALSLYLTNNEENDNYFRNNIYNFINDNISVYCIDFPYIMNNDEIIELEIMLSSKLLNLNIIVLKYKDKYKGYIQQSKFVSNNLISSIMFLEHVGDILMGILA